MKARLNISLFLVSFSVFLYQICLLRIISISDYYHFAFLVISIALLGFGISGSFLYFFTSRIKSRSFNLTIFGTAFSISLYLSFILINIIPFDSFRIVWELRQVFYLFAYYFFLLLPFFFGGLFIGYILYHEEKPGITYFFNLTGSAAGSMFFLFLAAPAGKTGLVFISIGSAAVAAFLVTEKKRMLLMSLIFLVFIIQITGIYYYLPELFEARMSPYKSLPAMLRIPGSGIVFSRENNYSRVDVIESSGIKSFPGLSLKYGGPLPAQIGITIDGDNLSPLTKADPEKPDSISFYNYMPISLIFAAAENNADGNILIIEPGGGIDVLGSIYLAGDSQKIYYIQSNDLVSEILTGRDNPENLFNAYIKILTENKNIQLIRESSRCFIKNTDMKFDLVILSLSDSFHPVSSGAYSLNENYFYTVESFEEMIKILDGDGILAVTRWMQVPPSEGLKVISILAESLNRLKIDNIENALFAFRSWSTVTVLFKNNGFLPEEIMLLKNRLTDLNFDLVYSKNADESETNLFNQLATPDYYRYFKKIIESDKHSRNQFYRDYYFNINPSTDNKPYFFDFFKLRQLPDIFKYFGKSTQPFGGGGYVVLLASLLISIILSLVFILMPLKFRKAQLNIKADLKYLVYFFMLGAGFFFIELPFIQKFILILGRPSYSLSIVLFGMMLSAGLGSFTSSKINIKLKWAILVIVLYILSFIFLFSFLEDYIMSKSITERIIYTVLLIFPLGFFMGMPFPSGILKAGARRKEIIPWLWAINGCASVIGSIAAIILSIHFGFLTAVGISALFYIAAYLVYRRF